MATFTETGVSVSVHLNVDADGTRHVVLEGWSHDASGLVMRSLPMADVTASLTAAQRNEALDLVNAAAAYLKALWGIA
jgi:hypothetical protein